MRRAVLGLILLVSGCGSSSPTSPTCRALHAAVVATQQVEAYACALQDAGGHQP